MLVYGKKIGGSRAMLIHHIVAMVACGWVLVSNP